MSMRTKPEDSTTSNSDIESIWGSEPGAEAIGRRIAAFRADKGLSLGELSELASVSKSYLSTVERGSGSRPGAEVLFKIAQGLDVTLADVLGRQVVANERPIAPELLLLAEERDLPPADVEMLAGIAFRGTPPKTKERWAFIYDAIMNSAGMDGR